jgi:acetolactate synthase-1/3 small subunit
MAVHDTTPVQEHILSVLVENQAGVLSHVVGLFSARGFNIDSLAVGETEDPTMSRITLVTRCDLKTFEQIKKQLNKLIDTIKVQDLTEEGYIDRELMMVKLKNSAETKAAIQGVLKQYQVRVIEETEKLVILESTESRENTKKIFEIYKKLGIKEVAQTGAVALSKKTPKD